MQIAHKRFRISLLWRKHLFYRLFGKRVAFYLTAARRSSSFFIFFTLLFLSFSPPKDAGEKKKEGQNTARAAGGMMRTNTEYTDLRKHSDRAGLATSKAS